MPTRTGRRWRGAPFWARFSTCAAALLAAADVAGFAAAPPKPDPGAGLVLAASPRGIAVGDADGDGRAELALLLVYPAWGSQSDFVESPEGMEVNPAITPGTSSCSASSPWTPSSVRAARRKEIPAQIHPPDTPRAILDGLGHAARPPPIAPARPEPEQLTLPDDDLEDPAA